MSVPHTNTKRIGGIDEAGRGPILGPLVVCGVVIDETDMATLHATGVRDSKLLTPKRRQLIARAIKEIALAMFIRIIDATDIDRLRTQGVNLNQIERVVFADISREMNAQIIYMDSPDIIPSRFEYDIRHISGLSTESCRLVAEHKADRKYPVVSAASVIAKVERDLIIQKMHEEYGDFGSGYPSDPKTVQFIRTLINNDLPMPNIVRKTWQSIDNIRNKTQPV